MSAEQPRDVAVLVGSLRKGSLNRMAANTLCRMGPKSLACRQVEIRDLPLYDPDLDETPPESWTAFRESVGKADAVLFVTPEYNRSVPAALKNAIDVGSRPYGKSAWKGKPAAVASVSPGAIGGFGANHHLRQSLVFLDMPVMQQPEAYWGSAGGFFGAEGEIVNPKTEQVMRRFVTAYAAWVETILDG